MVSARHNRLMMFPFVFSGEREAAETATENTILSLMRGGIKVRDRLHALRGTRTRGELTELESLDMALGLAMALVLHSRQWQHLDSVESS